jgi:acyl carrier protein
MRDQIDQFVIDALREMNYKVVGIDNDTLLGPAGIDLESLALAELAVRMEERYGVRFEEDDLERVAAMSIGELGDYLAACVAAVSPGAVDGREPAVASVNPA